MPPDRYNKTLQEHLYQQERDRIRREFFETYDVMTGVRIAATLGGFFGLMVFLIVWKSRSSSNETLKVLKVNCKHKSIFYFQSLFSIFFRILKWQR